MGRPRKYNAVWFRHDVNMRNDIHIRALRRKFGTEGYGILICLLEFLGEQDHFRMEINSQEFKTLALDLDLKKEYLTDFIQYCISIEVLELDENNGYLSAPILNKALEPLLENREKNRGKKQSSIAQHQIESNVFVEEKNILPSENEVFTSENKVLPSENKVFTGEKSHSIEQYRTVLSSTSSNTVNNSIDSSFHFKTDAPIFSTQGIPVILQDEKRMLSIQAELGIRQEDIMEWAPEFISFCLLRNKDPHKDFQDLSDHFIDWIRKKIEYGYQAPRKAEIKNNDEAKCCWNKSQAKLGLNTSSEEFRKMISSLTFLQFDFQKSILYIKAPNAEIRNTILRSYSQEIARVYSEICGKEVTLRCAAPRAPKEEGGTSQEVKLIKIA